MKNNKYKSIILIAVVFFFFFTISYLLPYTNDDWAWGSNIGIERLNNFFTNYNGRYLGNLLVILLTRFRLLKAIFVGGIFTSIIYLSVCITNKKNISILLLSILLMVFLPHTLFRQVFAWTSGFTNYVPPMLLVLIWVLVNIKLLDNKNIKISKIWIIPSFILGVSTCLFMEHVTLYIIFISFASLIYCLKKKIKININQVTYFIGTLVGAVLMFQNEAYFHVVAGDDFYRSVPKDGIIIQSIKRYFYTIYSNLFSNNVFLLIVITICLSYLFFKFVYKKTIKNKKIILYSYSYIIIYSVYLLVSCFFCKWESFRFILMGIEGILAFLYFISLVLFIIFIPNISKKRLLFYLLSIIILTVPLFVISPVTPRCFYPMYVMWSLFTLEIVNDVYNLLGNKSIFKVINYMLVLFIGIVMFYLTVISSSAFYINNKMVNYINRENKNNSNIVLPKSPYEDYMKDPNPMDNTNLKRFKMFYNIKNAVKVKFVDYKEWCDIIKK